MARRLGISGAGSGRHRRSNLMPTFHEWLSAVAATPLVGQGIEPPGGLALIVVLVGVGVLLVWLMNHSWPGPLSFRASNGAEGNVEKGARRLLKEYTGAFSDQASPDIVRRLLYTLGQESIVIIIIDEFDKVFSQETRAVMSNTLKFLSDRARN
jgi:hypothetical protein